MRFHILTLFPEAFRGPLEHSMLERARQRDLISFQLTDIRDYAHDAHSTADDYQFGGGAGMVMKPEPIFEAVEAALAAYSPQERAAIPIVLTSPQGRLLDQRMAQELAQSPALVLICGHYAGVDERVRRHLATHEISIGDYVLTGGELPAMVIVDTVARFVLGVVGAAENVLEDSITSGLLQHPLYTRPAQYRDLAVPEVLLSGNHAQIARWRREESLRRTLTQRPDLLDRAELSEEDRAFLGTLGYQRRGKSPLAPLYERGELPSPPLQRGVGARLEGSAREGISSNLTKAGFKFHTPVRVRWSESDIQGIAFNGAFMEYLEVGHAEYFRNLGFSIYQLARRGYFDCVMVKAGLEFKAPARLDDLLEVYVRVSRIGRTSFNVDLAIYPQSGPSAERLVATAQAVYVGFQPESGTTRPVPDDIRALVEHFEATGEVLPLQRFPRLAEAAS